ncbi:deaminase domain-containing protein [Paenibacillus sp. 203]|uniref:deaminase domain-containing protein n=1 Tax=Paenibacillus sp. 203 TaxID=3096765 RepID=UPI00300BE61C
MGKTAKVAAQTLHAHTEEQRARERHAMMDFLGKVWTSARGYGEVQSAHDFINYVKGVNQASVQAYSDIPKGTINLFTERLTCQSCTDVIMDFRREYPNITVNVLTNDGKVVK